MTTATAKQPREVIDATKAWQRQVAAEVTPLHQERLRKAMAIQDPKEQLYALEQVHALASLDLQNLERISAQRIEAYQALENGRHDDAIRNIRSITSLVRESGLPGLVVFVADMRTEVNTLGERMSVVENTAKGALDGVRLLQEQLNALQQEVANMKQQPSNTQVSDASTKAQRPMSGAEAATRAFAQTFKGRFKAQPYTGNGSWGEILGISRKKPEHSA